MCVLFLFWVLSLCLSLYFTRLFDATALLFILGLKKLGHPRTAPTGNLYGSMGMLVAVIVTIAQMDFGEINNFILIGAGLAIGASIG